MKRLTKTRLMEDGIRHLEVGDELLFSVEDIKKNYPEFKVDVGKIRELSYESIRTKFISLKDVEPLTDFDLKIRQSLGYNPNKK